MTAFLGRFGARAGDDRAFRPAWPGEVLERILARGRGCAHDLGVELLLATVEGP